MANTDKSRVEVNNNSRAANVAASITVENQQNDLRVVTETIEVVDHSRRDAQWVNSNNTSYTFNTICEPLTVPRSRSTPVQYMLNRSGLVQESDGVVWDIDRHELSSKENAVAVQKQIEHKWSSCVRPVVRELENALLRFQHQLSQDIESKDELPLRTQTTHANVLDALKQAKEYYRRGYQKQSKVHAILNRLGDMESFLCWLESVENEFRSILYAAIRFVFIALADGEDVKIHVLEEMAKSISIFHLASDYLNLRGSQRSIMGETADIFEQLVKLLTKLVSDQETKPRDESGAETERIAELLTAANTRARNWDKIQQSETFTPRMDLSLANGVVLLVVNPLMKLFESSPHNLSSILATGASMSALDQDSRQKRQFTSLGKSSKEYGTDGILAEGIDQPILLDLMGYRSSIISDDINFCIAAPLSEKHMQQLAALTRQPAFQAWLSEVYQSSALLIHGNVESDHEISPLSYLCSKIFNEYSTKDNFLVLTHFCSLHAGFRDSQANAVGVLRSMIGQILSYSGTRFVYGTETVHRSWVKKIKRGDVDTLCKTLKLLVRQFRKTKMIIFCLIDSIACYETSVRKKETYSLLKTLTKGIVKSQHRGDGQMVFKLMVTAAASSQGAHKYFEGLEKLEMGPDGATSSNARLDIEKKGNRDAKTTRP